jgi:hypothetical protein
MVLIQIGYDPFQAELMRADLESAGLHLVPISFSGKPAQEMASETLEAFAGRRVDLYPDPGLLDDLRRLRIKESVGGWKLDPPRTTAGHGDRGISFAMALYLARQRSYWSIPMGESAEPDLKTLSPLHPSNIPAGIFLPDDQMPFELRPRPW